VIVEDNTTRHIRQLIERYHIPSDIGAEGLRLGGELGLTLIAAWIRERSDHRQEDQPAQRERVEAHAREIMAEALEARAERGQDQAGSGEKRGELELRVHPDLSGAAVQAGLSSPLRLWHLMRALDPDGRGWVRRDQAWATWRDLGVSGARQFRNVVRVGEGLFWTISGDQLWLRGLEAVCRALGVKKLACDPVLLPATVLGGGLRGWNAWLFAAYLEGRPSRGNPIARETLAALTGVARSTQHVYEGITGAITKRPNYALDGRPGTAESGALLQRVGSLGWDDGGAFTWRDERGRLWTARRLGNNYDVVTGIEKAPHRGRCRAVNHRLADGLVETWSEQKPGDVSGQSRAQEQLDPAQRQGNATEGDERLYWRDKRALENAGGRGEVRQAYLDIGETKRGKANLWSVRRY